MKPPNISLWHSWLMYAMLAVGAMGLNTCSSVPLMGRSRVMLVPDGVILQNSFQKYRQFIARAPKESTGATMDLYRTAGGLKRLELGLQIGVGIEWSRLPLGLNYQLGLLNQAQLQQQRYLAQGGIISLGIRF